MRVRGIEIIALLVLGILLTAPVAIGETLDEREWLDASSVIFCIRSVLGEERTLELLRQLEIMHLALSDASGGALYESGIPTIILAVDNHDDYTDIGAESRRRRPVLCEVLAARAELREPRIPETANEHFASAIYLMAWDFNIWMDYARFWAQRVSKSRDGKARLHYSSRLIESLENALTIAEATPELNSLMGVAYLARARQSR